MSTLQEDLTSIDTLEDKVVKNKVARFAYTEEAYSKDLVDGVVEYDVNKDQNIPVGTASVMKVNETVLNKGYRAQASSITRMLMNHFLGRISYNLNKVNDVVSSFIKTVKSYLGSANGIATLDEAGRIPYTQLPESAMEFMGTWDASTNTPTLTDETGTNGSFYVVSVAGTQTFGGAEIRFNTNDRIIYDGNTSSWTKLSSGDVRTVNSIKPDETGNITLDAPDVNAVKTINNISPQEETGNINLKSLSINGQSFNGSASVSVDTMKMLYGGTGATTAKGAEFNITEGMESQTSDFTDTTKITCVQESPSVSTGRFFYSSASYLWNYIKGKISSVLGLTATNYGGTALNATNAEQATRATNDVNGNNIVNTYVLKSDLQYIKSINIVKADGSSSTWCYLIAKMPGTNSQGNLDSLFVNGSDYQYRMFEGSINTRGGNIVYNYGKDKLPIELYEQTDGTIYVYWLVNDFYNEAVLNIAATLNITIYGGNLSPVTPTGSKMTLKEYDYKSYDHIVHDDASLLEWANCTDGSMKKVLIKSGTYNMTKGVNLSNAGTGYVLAEQGAVIKSHVTTAFEKTTNALCSIYNLEVVCCVSENSSYCTAFKDSYSIHVFNKYLVLYNCKAGYDTVKLCNNYLFLSCWCFNCIFNAVSNTTTGMSVKTFSSCYCFNCACTLSVQGTTLFEESDFFRNCTCINCRGDIKINVDILYSTEAFCAFHYCSCTACDAVFTCAAPTLSVQTPCYCFNGDTHMSSCYAFADYQSTSTRHISGICDCSYISTTESNKWEGLNSKVDADSCNNS